LGLLDKANPQATPQSVRRAAIVFAVIAAVGYLAACIWNPYLREHFVILFPLLIGVGAALGSLIEWQVGPDLDMADVVYRVERAFDLKLDHVETARLLTVGDLLNAVREAIVTQHPARRRLLMDDQFRQQIRVEVANALGIDEDEVVESARFYFDIP
jgi:hypothetical protein